MRPHAASRLPRLDSLTGLRFVAAFVVFLAHCHSLLGGPLAADTDWFTVQGDVGVSFFFVLSGFVLTWSQRSDDRPGAFYRRRFARVYPSHLATWAIASILIAVGDFSLSSRTGALLGTVLLQAWVPDPNVLYAVNGVAWSLSAEAFFYLLFPLLGAWQLRLSSRARWVAIAVLAGGVVAVAAVAAPHVSAGELVDTSDSGFWLWLVYNCPATRFLEFAIGALLAANVRNGFRLPGVWRWCGLAVAAYAACGVWPSTFSRSALTLLPICGVLVAVAGRDLAGTSTVFGRRRFVKLGEWSFAFYLVHQLITHGVQFAFPPITSPAVALLVSAALLVAAVAAAWALHRLVEVPLERRLRGGAPRSAPGPA